MSRTDARVVPLEARLERIGETTVIRIPLRAEELRLGKETVVAERVDVSTIARRGVEHATETVAREELAVNTTQGLDDTRRLGLTGPAASPPAGGADPLRWANRIDDRPDHAR